jgi:predicted GH43/DUF377 family glycosyl hydrolase
MSNQKTLRGLGVAKKGRKVLLYYSFLTRQASQLQLDTSLDGINFYREDKKPEILTEKGKKEKIGNCYDFRISKLGKNQYFLAYRYQDGKEAYLCGALSQDLIRWQKIDQIASVKEIGMVVPHYQYQGKFVLFFGEKSIKLAYSSDLKTWKIAEKPAVNLSDLSQVKIANLAVTKEGILLTYYQWHTGNSLLHYSLKTVLFDKNAPSKPLWETVKTIWKQPPEWERQKINPVGAIKLTDKLISYWQVGNKGIFAIRHPLFKLKDASKLLAFTPLLKRFQKNPILAPLTDNLWESQAVFNPAAVYDEEKVHLIYRAVGEKAVSVLGYASSKDGIHVDKRLKKPIYTPREPFETNLQAPVCLPDYISGFGCGGCEDPRITKIDGRFYLTYTAWNGYQPPRVALTSISEEDFLNQQWDWNKSVLISPPHQTNKNWVIFPKKIKGKYALLHSLTPDIQIDFFDSLDFDGQTFINSYWSPKPKDDSWEVMVRGVGPPPIETKEGWLILYHAATNDCGYTMGAMILDKANPTKILYRSLAPILQPGVWYENEGLKPRIIYGCGAVVVDNRLLVYYGGSDTVTCVASAPLDKFLEKLKYTGRAHLAPSAGRLDLVYRCHD